MEMLVRTVDKTHPDPLINCSMTKRGDVIVVVENGHSWGDKDKTEPFWRIIKCPRIDVEMARAALLGPEMATTNPPSRVLRSHWYYLDLDGLVGLRDFILDDRRRSAFKVLNIDFNELLAFRKQRESLIDDAVIG